jgi:hypothetical protein
MSLPVWATGAAPGTWSAYDDGIVSGRLTRSTVHCDVCRAPTCCVEVATYNALREWRATIIWINHRDQELAVFLGMGCGCLARFHRQVAHIQDTIKKEG